MESIPEFVHADIIESVMPGRHDGSVWHYTDAAGILGILKSSSIWASSMLMMNDTDELIHGLALIQQRLADTPPLEYRELLTKWVSSAAAKIVGFDRSDSYIVCGSMSGDSHPQFLLYGPYAVEINGSSPLEKVASSHVPAGSYQKTGKFDAGWRPVVYQDEAKALHIDTLFDALEGLAKKHPTTFESNDPDIFEAAVECIIRSAAYMKRSSFSHENEVRLYGRAAMTNSQVNIRVGRYGLSPYLEVASEVGVPIAGGDFPIRSINVGPGLAQPESAIAGLHIALRHFEYQPLQIRDVSGSRRA